MPMYTIISNTIDSSAHAYKLLIANQASKLPTDHINTLVGLVRLFYRYPGHVGQICSSVLPNEVNILDLVLKAKKSGIWRGLN